MSFNGNEYLQSIANQVRIGDPSANIQLARGILVIHANQAFQSMPAECVVMHYDGDNVFAGLEENRVPVEHGQITSKVDPESLAEFSVKLGKLVGFKFQ